MSIAGLRQKVRHDVIRPMAMTCFRLFPNLAAAYRSHEELALIRKEASKFFAEGHTLPEGASREDFYHALSKHMVSIPEYFYQYDFYKLSESERDEFISRARMRVLSMKLRAMFPDDYNGISRFKEESLARFTPGLHHVQPGRQVQIQKVTELDSVNNTRKGSTAIWRSLFYLY